MKKKIARLGLPLFILLPTVGFLVSLLNIKSKTSAFVYVAFAMLFGYAISFTSNSADSYSYALAFSHFDNALDYNRILKLYREGELRDLYRLMLFYFTSIFTNNPKVMYAFAGLIYGVFSYLNFQIFVKEKGEKWDRYVFILALVFFTYISLANINGFRFWTGAMVLFYSTYNFIVKGKLTWIIGIIITPLFHYGFMLSVPLLLLYSFFHSMLYSNKGIAPVILYTFIVAFFISWILGTNSIKISFLSEADVLQGAIGNRIDRLNSDDITSFVESRRESSLFLSVRGYFNYGIKIYVFISVLFLNKLLKRMKESYRVEFVSLFTFVLFFYSFAFIATSFPSGIRFMNIAHLFLVLLIVKFYVIYSKLPIRNMILLALPVFSFSIASVNGLVPLSILTPTFWYGNIFWIIIEGMGFSLR